MSTIGCCPELTTRERTSLSTPGTGTCDASAQHDLDATANTTDPQAHDVSDRRTATDATPALRCIVHAPGAVPDGFSALAAEWNALLQKSRFDTLFLTYEWQTTWWDYLGEGELWILAFRCADTDDLIGIVPLYRYTAEDDEDGASDVNELVGQTKLTLVGCIEVSDYLDFIVARGWEEPVYRGLLNWLHSADAPHWDVLDLCNLPEDSLTYTRFATLAEQSGLRVTVQQEDVAPQFGLPLHFDTYLQEHVDKKQRHEIRRKQRRAEREAEVGFTIVGMEPERDKMRATQNGRLLEAELDDFIRLQRASATDKAQFMTPHMERFFKGMARRMFDVGYLRLCFLTLDGERAATLLAFDYKKRFLLYNSGYDPNAHAQLSPGWVLLASCIQYAIPTGGKLFDFMQGDEAYKYHFGSQDYKVMRVLVYR